MPVKHLVSSTAKQTKQKSLLFHVFCTNMLNAASLQLQSSKTALDLSNRHNKPTYRARLHGGSQVAGAAERDARWDGEGWETCEDMWSRGKG